MSASPHADILDEITDPADGFDAWMARQGGPATEVIDGDEVVIRRPRGAALMPTVGLPYFDVDADPRYSICPACGERVGPEEPKDFESFRNDKAQQHWAEKHGS